MRVVENGGKIKIQNYEYPITLSYNIKNDENKSGNWKLLNPSSGDEYILSSSGTFEFSSPIDEIILATEEEIIDATKEMWERMKIIVEPSCALTLATIIANKEKFEGQNVVLIITGGNVDLVDLPWQKVGKD